MAQHDFNIANQSFPSFRTDLNNALSAINTSQSGTSRPSGAVAGTIWLDTTSATTPTLKYYDGADDISLATLDHSANTVNWLDSTVSITGLSTTATGTVLTLTDSASTSTVNLIIDNQKEIRFRETTANGTNYIGLKAPASVTADLTFTLPVAPTVNNQALISSTAGVMAFTPYTFPTSDGTASQVLQTNGSGVLSFSTISAGGITEADQWRVTANITSDVDPIASNLERVDNTGFGYIGTGMSVASGTWTFPSTGIYLVRAIGDFSAQAGDNVLINIRVTVDNSSYTTVAFGGGGEDTSLASRVICEFLFDVTSTANCKVRFSASSITAGSLIMGDTSINRTSFTFIRLGDT
jgi:hypothetical protein